MKYDATIKTKDAAAWTVAVNEEHDHMVNNNVWKPIDRAKIPSNSKVLTSTWAMKKKASGKFRARLNARGFEQVDGIHCDKNTKSAPVTHLRREIRHFSKFRLRMSVNYVVLHMH